MSRLNLELLKPYHARSVTVARSSNYKTKPLWFPTSVRDDLFVPLKFFTPERGFTLLFTKKHYHIIILASTMDLSPAELDSDWEDDEEHFVKPVPMKQLPLYINYTFLSPHFDRVLKGEPFDYQYPGDYAPSSYTVKDWEN
jgi:hypothetical protein